MNIEKIEQNKIEIGNYVEKFLNYIDVEEKTVKTYKIALRQFCNYLKEKGIKNPTREDIINYREHMKTYLSINTINAYLIAIRNLYNFLEYEGITKNITKNIKGIKMEKRHLKRGLSQEEIRKVLSVCKDDRETLLIKLMINCGLRCIEVVNIELNDFYDDKGVVMLRLRGKGRGGEKQDLVKINDMLFQEIQKYVKNNKITDYLFVSTSNNNKGGKVTTKTIREIVTNLFKKADLDMNMLSPHSTRHSTCETLLENGVPIQEVSEFMRHKSIATTMTYSRELDQRNSQCSNILAGVLF